ncbi:MAG: glycosyltransferase family 4 protein [Desulfobacterales bacterium]|nr:glycosyltransferase family 4 protein [Desulfobacterales bacterium]
MEKIRKKKQVRLLVIMLYWYPYEGPLMPIYGRIFQDLINKGYQITLVTSFPHFRKGRSETWEEYRGKLYEVSDWKGVKLIRSWVFAPIFGQSNSGLFYRALNFISFNLSSTLAALFLGGKADILFAPSSPPLTNGLVCWLVSKFKRCSMVYNVQDLYPDMAVEMGLVRSRSVVKLLVIVEKLVYGLAKKVLTISEGMAAAIRRKGVPDDKVEVIENFIDTEDIQPQSKNNLFSRYYGIHDKFVILYAGNIGIPHGVEILVSAAEMLKTQKDMVFCFVARGERKDMVQTLAAKKKLKNVKFIDPQPESWVPLIWASASVGAITYRSGLADFSVPSKLLACMCAQRPVIAVADHDSGTAAVVVRAGCGLTVTPGSVDELSKTILRLKNNEVERRLMGENGRNYVKNNLNRSNITERYDIFFRNVVMRRT